MTVITSEVVWCNVVKVVLKNGAVFKAKVENYESEFDAEYGIPALQVEILEVFEDNKVDFPISGYLGRDILVEFKEPEIESIEVLK